MSIIRQTADLFSQVLRMVLRQRMIIPAKCAASKITPLYITNRFHIHLLILHQPKYAKKYHHQNIQFRSAHLNNIIEAIHIPLTVQYVH